MIKLIAGKKGTGKTKLLIDAIHAAEQASKGNVVAIQIGSSQPVNIVSFKNFKKSSTPYVKIAFDLLYIIHSG